LNTFKCNCLRPLHFKGLNLFLSTSDELFGCIVAGWFGRWMMTQFFHVIAQKIQNGRSWNFACKCSLV